MATIRKEDKKKRDLLPVWVSKDLQRKFKSKCAAAGISMAEATAELISNYVK